MQKKKWPVQKAGWKNRYTEFYAPKVQLHAQNSPHHKFSCRFQELRHRAKYARCLFCCNMPALAKIYGVSDSRPHTGQPENLKLIISVFLCTFELSALLLEKFHLHLGSYTLLHM